MTQVIVIFAPIIHTALENIVDFDEHITASAMLDLIERIEIRLVSDLAQSPTIGPIFRGSVRMFQIENYVFLYEYHQKAGKIYILDIVSPTQNWR